MFDNNSIKISNTKELKSQSLQKRLYNIEAFSNIDRNGLEYSKLERKLLLYESRIGEKVYIQYPGKESVSDNRERLRPWDFRPKLELANGSYMKDLSFADIWDDLVDMHINDNDSLAILATVFYRMICMVDTVLENMHYSYLDINVVDNYTMGSGTQRLNWYKYMPDFNLLNYFNEKIGTIRGASLEAYLYYNDLLVQNEDCKYFYRDTIINNKNWDSKVGRFNTFMTHISIIEYIQGKVKFSEVMNRFQRGRGVAPATQKSLPDITNKLIT